MLKVKVKPISFLVFPVIWNIYIHISENWKTCLYCFESVWNDRILYPYPLLSLSHTYILSFYFGRRFEGKLVSKQTNKSYQNRFTRKNLISSHTLTCAWTNFLFLSLAHNTFYPVYLHPFLSLCSSFFVFTSASLTFKMLVFSIEMHKYYARIERKLNDHFRKELVQVFENR